MLQFTTEPMPTRTYSHDLLRRGYMVNYRPDEVNYCPGCGRSHWYVGRLSAECGFCGTAVPLTDSMLQSSAGGHSRNRRLFDNTAWAA